jgi:hypothetical protein
VENEYTTYYLLNVLSLLLAPYSYRRNNCYLVGLLTAKTQSFQTLQLVNSLVQSQSRLTAVPPSTTVQPSCFGISLLLSNCLPLTIAIRGLGRSPPELSKHTFTSSPKQPPQKWHPLHFRLQCTPGSASGAAPPAPRWSWQHPTPRPRSPARPPPKF